MARAESGRVRAESGRVRAESGRVRAESGRVRAESGRVREGVEMGSVLKRSYSPALRHRTACVQTAWQCHWVLPGS